MSNGSIWIVYILESQVSGKLYTGITNDLERRLKAHNNGTGAKCTRAGRPWVVVHQEPMDGKSSALKREIVIKKLSRSAKITLIQARRLDPPSLVLPRPLVELEEPLEPEPELS